MCFDMKKWNKKIKKLDMWDISLIKLSAAAFMLVIVKFIPGIMLLDWYWYLLIAALLAIRPMKKSWIFGM